MRRPPTGQDQCLERTQTFLTDQFPIKYSTSNFLRFQTFNDRSGTDMPDTCVCENTDSLNAKVLLRTSFRAIPLALQDPAEVPFEVDVIPFGHACDFDCFRKVWSRLLRLRPKRCRQQDA